MAEGINRTLIVNDTRQPKKKKSRKLWSIKQLTSCVFLQDKKCCSVVMNKIPTSSNKRNSTKSSNLLKI